MLFNAVDINTLFYEQSVDPSRHFIVNAADENSVGFYLGLHPVQQRSWFDWIAGFKSYAGATVGVERF